jgi:hypothetical protein
LYFCASKASKLSTSQRARMSKGTSPTTKVALPNVAPCQHTSAYVSIRQHTSAYVSIRQHRAGRRRQQSRSRKLRYYIYIYPTTDGERLTDEALSY